jgi:hypothetical protein
LIAAALKTATTLWREASKFLFALGAVLLLAFVVLAIGARVDPDTFGEASHKWAAVLLVSSLSLLVFGAFKYHAEQSIRTVELVPFGPECIVSIGTQPDGRQITQITSNLEVFNLTDQTIWLARIRLAKPRTSAPLLHHNIIVQEQAGRYHGDYEIPPRGKTRAQALIIVDANLAKRIRRKGLVLQVADQHRHWHTLKFPSVKIV